MLSLTLRQLDYATAVARHGGITRAAEALHVSQPALSVALRGLEALLGQELFLRRPGGRVVPTAFGAVWLAEAERLRAGLTRLADPSALAVVPLRLALFEDLAATCLAPLIAAAPRALPGIALHPQVMGFGPLAASLRDGVCDLALTWDLGLGAGIDRVVLRHIPPHAVLAPDHPLAARPALNLADLAEQPLVLADQGPSLIHLRALFARTGLDARIAHRTATLDIMRSYAANGLGVGLSYTDPAPRLSQDGKPFVTRALLDAGTEPVVLAALAGRPPQPAAAALVALLRRLLAGDA